MSKDIVYFFLGIHPLNEELESRNLLDISNRYVNKIEPFLNDLFDYILAEKMIKYMVLKGIHITDINKFNDEINILKKYMSKNSLYQNENEIDNIERIYHSIYSNLSKIK